MRLPLKSLTTVLALTLFITACRKQPIVKVPVPPYNPYVSMDGIVFDTLKSKMLNTHLYALDTQKQAYTLTGFGVFAGKTRTVKFSDGGSFRNVPVIRATGFDDYGAVYLAKDSSGAIWNIYQQRFNTTGFAWSIPITVFTPKAIQSKTQWNAWAGFEQGMNSMYYLFKAQVIDLNATSPGGTTGCIELEHTAPDYADTVFIKPGKGPVEFRSWRAHMRENNQPGYGGYR